MTLAPLAGLVLAWRFLPQWTLLPLARRGYAGLLDRGWDVPDAHFTAYFLEHLVDTLFGVALVVAGMRLYRLSTEDLGWRPAPRSSLFWAAVLVIPVFGAVYALDLLPDAFFFKRFPALRWTIDPAWGLWANSTAYHRFFTRAFLTPISEELLHRGLIQGVLRSRYGRAIAVTTTAFTFAALHPAKGIADFAGGFLTALLFGLLRERTGSLFPPMAAHFVWNLWATVVQFRPLF